MSKTSPLNAPATNFVRNIVSDDLKANTYGGRVATRFPPEPNGYLHIGHAKSICLNFGVARDFGGECHMRFDDTNPTKEDTEYVDSILDAVKWLGFSWGETIYYASDYFEHCYEYAVHLIQHNLAYVDSLTADEIRSHRGTLTEPGKPSPYRDRSIEENIDLFSRMRAGEFPDGAHVVRAKIDMSSPNMNLRDPALFRIRHHPHWRTGDSWCIYPMYDYAHAVSDAVEHITHSICTLEFEDHRPLYDWVIENCPVPYRPRQYEFARLNLTYTMMSKRKLLELVQENLVEGWDDPRMPTIVGLRRRGYTPGALRLFCERIGVSKADSLIDVSVLEDCLRDDLNDHALRGIAVLDPVKLVIENFPLDTEEICHAPNHPQKKDLGHRDVPFSRELWIEREDFMAEPTEGFFRMVPGGMVRLRYAYVVKCTGFSLDAHGEVNEIRAEYFPESRSGTPGSDTFKVKGNIHWLSDAHSIETEVRVYDRLFNDPNPAGAEDFRPLLNPNSKSVLAGARIEKCLLKAEPGSHWQFERKGYFCVDTKDSQPSHPVFNLAVTLKDTWQKR
jgi:glutaminyl-tRNA synthetase